MELQAAIWQGIQPIGKERRGKERADVGDI
jgi:hypothetical protein